MKHSPRLKLIVQCNSGNTVLIVRNILAAGIHQRHRQTAGLGRVACAFSLTPTPTSTHNDRLWVLWAGIVVLTELHFRCSERTTDRIKMARAVSIDNKALRVSSTVNSNMTSLRQMSMTESLYSVTGVALRKKRRLLQRNCSLNLHVPSHPSSQITAWHGVCHTQCHVTSSVCHMLSCHTQCHVTSSVCHTQCHVTSSVCHTVSCH